MCLLSSLDWYRDGSPLRIDVDRMAYENGLLMINYLEYNDSGTYSCLMAGRLVGLFTLQVHTRGAQLRVPYNTVVPFDCREANVVKHLGNRTVTIKWTVRHPKGIDTVGEGSHIRFRALRSGRLECSVVAEQTSLAWTTFSAFIDVDGALCSRQPFVCFALVLIPLCLLVFLFAGLVHRIETRNEILDNLVLAFMRDFKLQMDAPPRLGF
jgi:hypothetical protein